VEDSLLARWSAGRFDTSTGTSSDERPNPTRERPGAPIDVVGLGEVSLDFVARVPGAVVRRRSILLDADSKLEGEHFEVLPGGQIAGALLGCTRLGMSAAFIGCVGGDEAAELALAPLRHADIDLSGLQCLHGVGSRRALILVAADGAHRSVIEFREPRLRLSVERLDGDLIRRARALLIDCTDPEASEWAAALAREEGVPVVLDADREWPKMDRLLRHVDFPVVTAEFAEKLGGSGSLEDGLRCLLEYGAHLAVATRGARGALALDQGRIRLSPALATAVHDTTGAGDAFRAGFVWGLLQGLPVHEVLRCANGAGALNCEGIGAQEGLPDRAQLDRLLAATQR